MPDLTELTIRARRVAYWSRAICAARDRGDEVSADTARIHLQASARYLAELFDDVRYGNLPLPEEYRCLT